MSVSYRVNSYVILNFKAGLFSLFFNWRSSSLVNLLVYGVIFHRFRGVIRSIKVVSDFRFEDPEMLF